MLPRSSRTIHNINHTRLVRNTHRNANTTKNYNYSRNQHHIPELTMSVQIVPNGSGKDEELAKYENIVGNCPSPQIRFVRVTSNQVQVIDKTQSLRIQIRIPKQLLWSR